eukprot:251994-Rhodomonas_salina.1
METDVPDAMADPFDSFHHHHHHHQPHHHHARKKYAYPAHQQYPAEPAYYAYPAPRPPRQASYSAYPRRSRASYYRGTSPHRGWVPFPVTSLVVASGNADVMWALE